MDAATCVNDLRALLTAESSALLELASLFEREYQHLSTNEVAALDTAILERKRCISRLHSHGEERRALCRRLGHAADLEGFERLLSWCDPARSLRPLLQQCSELAARCRTLNDRNAVLVGARLKHVQARLAVLFEGRGDPVIYGPRGSYTPPTSGRVVKTEA
jgi:flagellar biosynthesis/type III secretory pathway chaperone